MDAPAPTALLRYWRLRKMGAFDEPLVRAVMPAAGFNAAEMAGIIFENYSLYKRSAGNATSLMQSNPGVQQVVELVWKARQERKRKRRGKS